MISSSFLVAVQRGCTQTFTRPISLSMVQCCLQSTQAVPAARLPYRVKVSAGKRYAWCACGHSKKQPFCDGAHKSKAPSISPLRFTPDKDRTVMLCACKQTKNAPYCDGSHFKVIFRDIVKSVKGIFK
ncbi:CDGSH iron-sulfur domain-containing protein 3, mitochondrial-like [Epinephelus fuscoguttatus]|uniref:CDGSH iron-sulfur domain-containing protein 3, mitochondrial-like n=1 Tax=Epinephelus fuscoguttatus TaxID=293821 RepID=UPI0020D17D40|nr:CDGSH iron-sulfur domain-containing protein 3, mitochondrial-like [Epinephelus fuscoguttatus]